MMRVSSGMMIGNYMRQINSSYANQAKLMEQSDGSNLHRPSDNSVRYSRYLTYQNRDTENLQYQDNVKAGASWMKTADAAMVNMTDIYTTLKEKTVDAGNDTNNDSDLITAISKEFKAKLYEMVSLGNNQQGDRYLFAGQSDLTQPFVISTEEKDRGLVKVLDDPQSKFFKNPNDTKNLNADDTGNLTQFLEVNDSDGNRFFVNTQNGRIYTEDFIQNGYKDKLQEGQDYVKEGDEFATLPFFETDALKVSGYFENTGVIRVEGDVTITDSSGGSETTTLKYGDKIELKTGETAKSTVPVYIKDKDGNTRVVAKGNEVSIDTSKAEEAFVGVPLNATKYQNEILTLSSSSASAQEKTLGYGEKLIVNVGETAKADTDVEYSIYPSIFSDGAPKVYKAKAGDPIPGSEYDADHPEGNYAVEIKSVHENTKVMVVPNTDSIEVTKKYAGDKVDLSESVTNTVSDTDWTNLEAALKSATDSDEFAVCDTDVTVKYVTKDSTGAVTSEEYKAYPAGTAILLPLGADDEVKVGIAADNKTDYDAYTTPTSATDLKTLTFSKVLDGDVIIKKDNGDSRIVKAGNPVVLADDESAENVTYLGKPLDSYHYNNFVTIKQPIVTYHGDAKYISMVKLNGSVDQTADTINATGQDLNGSNIFDDANSGNQTQVMSNGKLCYVSSGTAMINDMFTVCAKLEHGDREWMRTDGVTIADMAHEVITTTQSKTAARQNVYDSVSEMLTKQNETITEDINNVSGTNIAELAVRLMEAQTIYNMSLSMGSRILPPTLADYL